MGEPVVDDSELPQLMPGRPMLEGPQFGLDHITVVLGISPPGQHIRLHRHDYEEIFIIHSGLLIPSGVPHGFSNLNQKPLDHTAVHSSGTFVVEWLG